MTIKACNSGDHRRDKRRATRHRDTWRSYCTRCNMRLERVSPGVWTEVAVEDEVVPSRERVDFASLPALRPAENLEKPTLAAVDQDSVAPVDDRLAWPFMSDTAAGRRAYYAARAMEARSLADAAADRSIGLIHLEMALRYDLLAHHDVDEERPLRIVR